MGTAVFGCETDHVTLRVLMFLLVFISVQALGKDLFSGFDWIDE